MQDLVPLIMPPGFFRNGTEYMSKNRWRSGNLVRWYNGSVRNIRGWLRRTTNLSVNIPSLVADASLEVVRDAFSWRDNDLVQNFIFGSNLGVYHLSSVGTITDVTPVGAVTSGPSVITPSGFGSGAFGAGAFGAENAFSVPDLSPPVRWAFTTFGEVLLAQQRGDGPIYDFDTSTLTFTAVAGAPIDNQDILVSDSRHVIAIGAGGEPLRIEWSDRENRTQWTPADDNQAGGITLSGSSKLLAAVEVQKSILVLSETAAYVGVFVGAPYVFSFDKIEVNCGPVAAQAVASTGSLAFWWGVNGFYQFDGVVQSLPCDVLDFLKLDVNILQISKVNTLVNADFNEIWWFYQSLGASEVDSYVVYNYAGNFWFTGRLNRTACIPRGANRYPIMVDNDGFIYNHEVENVQPTGEVYIETGPIEAGFGARNLALKAVYNDTEQDGATELTVYAKQMPTEPEYAYGPYAYNNPTDTRVLGRQLRFRFDAQLPTLNLGVMRLDIAPVNLTGKR